MKRREFISLMSGAAASPVLWPLAARAQRTRAPHRRARESSRRRHSRTNVCRGVRTGAQQLGWVDGRNARTDMRWAAGDPARYRKYSAELAALAPDVVFAATSAAVVAMQQASPAVPIVFVGAIDPVGSGLITSMARPGGNATGFTIFE